MSWSALAGRLLSGDHTLAAKSDDKDLVQSLGTLLKEFFAYRTASGLTRLFVEYGTWLADEQ